MKSVIYIRESSDEGVKNTNGPENQLRECMAYAAAHGLGNPIVLSDEGISGRIPMAERPHGAELWRMITHGEVEAVIAARKDRFSRDEWGIELPTFLRHCTKHKVQVHAVHEGGHLRADMAGRVMASFGDIMGGEERRKNSERMFAGRRTAWEKGKLIPTGRWDPFGFRRVNRIEKNGHGADVIRRDFVLDEAQADAVRECYRLLIEDHLSARQIAIRMGARVPNLRHYTNIFRILKNPIYKGEFHYGDFATLKREDLVIVSPATFAAAQEQLKVNAKAAKRSLKNEYLLRMTMRCHCGRNMSCKPNRKRRLYACPSIKDLFKADRHPYFWFDAEQLDELVWTELVRILSDRKLLKQAAREYAAAQGDKIKPLRARLSAYRAELQEAEAGADEYIQRAGRKGLSEELLTRYELEAQRAMDRAKEIKDRIGKTEAELATLPRYDEREIDRMASLAAKKLAHGAPTFEQKLELVRWANLKGQIMEGKIEFTLELGLRFDIPAENLRAPNRARG